MIRDVLHLPNRLLKARAVEVDSRDPRTKALADDLVDTMRGAPGCVGLAAPQVGVGQRVVCVDVSGHRKARSCHGLVVLANPILLMARPAEVAREGCMSVPHVTANVARAAHVVVQGEIPGTGEVATIEADAFEARALLHEIDHLDGLLFLDRVESARHDVFLRKRYK